MATEPGPGLVRLMRFGNGYEWRMALESKTADLLSQGYRLDGPAGYVYADWLRAGAVYFGMFNADGHAGIIARSQQVYGRPDWWGGVRDFHDGTPYATQNWPGTDFSYLKPAIGYYDDSQPATLERQIDQATSAGLQFFSFYWYWDSSQQREVTTRAALDAFLAAPNRNRIDFTVAVCAHPWGGLGIPRGQFGTVAAVLVDRYLAQPNTLRTNDGRKILTLCDVRAIGDGQAADIHAFTDAVRQRARAMLGEDVYVMINHGSYDPRQVPVAGGDAAYCTVDGPAVEQRSYATYLARQRSFFAEAPAAYGRCVMSDFDERPRYPIEQTDLAKIRWFPDQSMSAFRQALRSVRADIQASTRPPEADNLVFVYAWNEWHEGGVIEPNERDGCAYLDAIRQELSLVSSSGCSTGGP